MWERVCVCCACSEGREVNWFFGGVSKKRKRATVFRLWPGVMLMSFCGDLVPAAATTTSASTAPAPAPAAVAATTATARGPRLGFADFEGSAAAILAVESVDGSLCFCVAAHFDESKALALAGAAISDDLHTFDGTVRAEHLFEV